MLSPADQTVLVTGATDGLGRALATRLAQLGATVLLHGRDEDRLEQTRQKIERLTGATKVHTLCADLSSLAEVDRLADEVERQTGALHLLISNAGVGYGPPEGEREVSADGYELRFAVNHLASHHLARRLAPLMVRSAPARIVQVASAGQVAIDVDDLQTERDWDGVTAYRRSKLAQTMSALDHADDLRDSGVTVHVLHPASHMDTTMVREAEAELESTLEEGVTAIVRIALDPTLDEVTGRFFSGTPESPETMHDQVGDDEMRTEVRRRTEDLIEKALTQVCVC